MEQEEKLCDEVETVMEFTHLGDRVKSMTPKSSRNHTCRKCDGDIGEAVKQEERLCDEMETVREFTYLGDRVSAGGGCETAVTARTSCGWAKFRECGELLYGRRYPLRLKGAVDKSYVRPAMLYGSEAWRLKKVRWEFYEGLKDPW